MPPQPTRGQSHLQAVLPTCSYIPAPSLGHITCQASQSTMPNHHCFLSKMGYPQTFPWAVVYAPRTCGSLGFCHLSAEQGIQKALQVLKHLRADTTTGKVYHTLINHYQLNASFSTPVLKDTTAIPWSTAYWVDTLCEYLHQIGRQILGQQAWSTKPWHSHDQSIIEALLQANIQLSTHELKIINNMQPICCPTLSIMQECTYGKSA